MSLDSPRLRRAPFPPGTNSEKADAHLAGVDIVAGIMHFRFLALAATGLLALAQNTAAQTQFKYPAAPTNNQVDDYNGVKVADPYRPLENPDSPASQAWIEAENKITFDFLKRSRNATESRNG